MGAVPGRRFQPGGTRLASPHPPLRLLLAPPELPDGEAPDRGAGLLDDAKAMELAEWCYFNVEEVWSGFNLLAEAVSRGFRVTAPTKALQRDVDAWSDRVHLADAVRMWVKSALIYGRSTTEATREFLKVRNPRFLRIHQDQDGAVTRVVQELPTGTREVPVDRFHVFTLHALTSDDVRGVSAVHPVLQTIDDMLEARKVQRVLNKRYRAPIRLIELPADATEADRHALRDELEETPPDLDLILPAGAKVHVLGHGEAAFQPDDLMKQHLTDRIFMGLGIPKIALGIPDGSNRAVSNVQRDLLLADKVAPYQRRVKWFAENLLHRVFGRWPTVTFDPVAAQDDLALAQVSKILVEAGIKTPQEVAEHYFDWGPA